MVPGAFGMLGTIGLAYGADGANPVAARLRAWTAPTLQPVINATGVIIHTNLGRAPLSKAAIQAMQAVSLGYSNQIGRAHV